MTVGVPILWVPWRGWRFGLVALPDGWFFVGWFQVEEKL